MFEYPSLPDTEYEARAAIWAALNELAFIESLEGLLSERCGTQDQAADSLLMGLEYRRDAAREALDNYGGSRWLSSQEYSEWWGATVGQTSSSTAEYCFDW